MISELKSESNLESICEKKAEEIDEKEEDVKISSKNPSSCCSYENDDNEKEILPRRTRLSLRKRNSLNNDLEDFSTETNGIKSGTELSNNLDIVVKLETKNKSNKTLKETSQNSHSNSQNSDDPLVFNGEKYFKEKIPESSLIPTSSEDLHALKKRKISSENPYEDVKNAANQSLVNPIEKKQNSLKSTSESMKDLNKTDKVVEDMTTIMEETEADENKEVFHVPYYLENFKMILSQVLQDGEYDSLINNEDRDTVKKFHSLSGM